MATNNNASSNSRSSDGGNSTERTTTTSTKGVIHERSSWVRRDYPKWWLAVPSLAGLAALSAWQLNSVRGNLEHKLEDSSAGALSGVPGASVKFHGRDAVITGLTPADANAAHSIVRNLKGVRHVTESVAAPAVPVVTSTPPPAPSLPTQTAPAPTLPSQSLSTTIGSIATLPSSLAPASVPAPTSGTLPPTSATPATSTPPAPTTGSPASAPAPATPIAAPDLSQTIVFDSGSCELSPNSWAALDTVAKALKDNPAATLQVGGYADASGTPMSNMAVSRCRANAVRDAMMHRGIDVSRVDAKGYGSSRPIGDNATEDGRAKNRRVELSMTGPGTGPISYTG